MFPVKLHQLAENVFSVVTGLMSGLKSITAKLQYISKLTEIWNER
jgi:hypothetical protein